MSSTCYFDIRMVKSRITGKCGHIAVSGCISWKNWKSPDKDQWKRDHYFWYKSPQGRKRKFLSWNSSGTSALCPELANPEKASQTSWSSRKIWIPESSLNWNIPRHLPDWEKHVREWSYKSGKAVWGTRGGIRYWRMGLCFIRRGVRLGLVGWKNKKND